MSDGPELIERSVKIRRVSKVVKGGRNLSFSALMVVGDGQGRVGAALGRSTGVPDAVRKGRQRAEASMRKVVVSGSTIPHEVMAKFGASKVLLLPAAPGTGVIAGGGIRAVLEAAGIEDVLSKNYGSRNSVNTVRATIKALELLRDPKAERARRLGYHYDPEADAKAAEMVIADADADGDGSGDASGDATSADAAATAAASSVAVAADVTPAAAADAPTADAATPPAADDASAGASGDAERSDGSA